MTGADARLRDDLLECFGRGAGTALSDAGFDALARRVFARQFASNPTYRAYCERRGATPDTVAHWSAIPAVPTAAFKVVRLVSDGGAGSRARVFRTSGTTQGREQRGTHVVPDPALYDASLLATFEEFVLPDGARPVLLSLVPSAAELADSSLAYMITVLIERLGAPGSGVHSTARSGLDVDGLLAALDDARERGQTVALLGTSLSFTHLLDALDARGMQLRLPAGSRLMDTGGYKGVGRRVEPRELRQGYARVLGLPIASCVNEYGMTELCSQCYDTVLRDLTAANAPADAEGGVGRRKAGPPWLRSRVVNPETLEPVEPGETGILQHFDLANVGSVLAVQTEDLAVEVEGGFVLIGRAAGAPPRGCSIAMDLLLRSAREAGA